MTRNLQVDSISACGSIRTPWMPRCLTYAPGTRPDLAELPDLFLHPSYARRVDVSRSERAALALRRLSDRLRSLPESRLRRREPGLSGSSPAEAAYELATWCATASSDGMQSAPKVRQPTVPRLSDLASGDQVWVLGTELLASTRRRPSGEADAISDELVRRIQRLTAAL